VPNHSGGGGRGREAEEPSAVWGTVATKVKSYRVRWLCCLSLDPKV
jgi:hypothetical protein